MVLRAIAKKLRGNEQPQSEPVDVKQLIAGLSHEELLAAADAYFAGLDADSEQCHKPFSNVDDAVRITGSLSLLLEAADLFHGADVLDFGCATGWLSLSLANLGCRVVGVDIAPAALRLAEALYVQRGIRSGGTVQFRVYDGNRLPLGDSSVDRVVCFDAFHHVRDQAASLQEMARVLRPGGRIAMLEPGPRHSQSAQSQAEMRQYKVIENDIVMADIAAAATKAGLSEPRLLMQMYEPVEVSFTQYQQWSESSRLPLLDSARFARLLHRRLTTRQCFYLEKPGSGVTADSRRADALAAEITLLSCKPLPSEKGSYELRFCIRNTGTARWIAQADAVGQVSLGCQLLRSDHTVKDLNFQRFALGGTDLLPGETRVLDILLRVPYDSSELVRFDLVAEHTAWFAQQGRCKPVTWQIGCPQ